MRQGALVQFSASLMDIEFEKPQNNNYKMMIDEKFDDPRTGGVAAV